MEKETGIKIVTTNKKASFNYFLSDFLEVGIELSGTEIKSIRNHNISISDAYVIFNKHEAYVINMNISEYEKGNIFNHDPLRNRRLLMHKKEILKFEQKIAKEGYTVIPTKVYLKKGKAKLEIALGKGKKLFDKRDSIKERDDKRYIEKNMKRE